MGFNHRYVNKRPLMSALFDKFGDYNDTTTILKMTLLLTTLNIMRILIAPNTGGITYNDITHN